MPAVQAVAYVKFSRSAFAIIVVTQWKEQSQLDVYFQSLA